ncbi:unnamed protein product, partial [marine sediment metagenome]
DLQFLLAVQRIASIPDGFVNVMLLGERSTHVWV